MLHCTQNEMKTNEYHRLLPLQSMNEGVQCFIGVAHIHESSKEAQPRHPP